MDKRRAVEAIQLAQNDGDTSPAAVSAALDKARITAKMHKAFVQDQLTVASEKLTVLTAAPRR